MHLLHRAYSPFPAQAAAEAVESALLAGTSTFLHSMEVFLPWWKVGAALSGHGSGTAKVPLT